MCLHMLIYTQKRCDLCKFLPKFINHIRNRLLISVSWCSLKHTGTCPHDRHTHKHTHTHTQTHTQPLWHMLNKTLDFSKPIQPTYAEHSMGSTPHCAAVWHSAGLSFNLESITQVGAERGNDCFPSKAKSHELLLLLIFLKGTLLYIQRVNLTQEHGKMRKIVSFWYARWCTEVAQELGVQTQTHPVPYGGMWLEMRGGDGGLQGKKWI